MKKMNKYLSPEISKIVIDNEISLVLLSDAPAGPDEGLNMSPDFHQNNPMMA